MQRRNFVGSLIGGAGLAGLSSAGVWRALNTPAAGDAPTPLPDGRVLVRGAATAFGTTVAIAALHRDPARARNAVSRALNETQRIDALLSLHRSDSQLSQLNRDGSLAQADPHLLRNLEFGLRLGDLSAGAFDVSIQPLWRLWARHRSQGSLPLAAELASARRQVDWRAVSIEGRRVRVRSGTELSLNGLAQGYAADVAGAMLADDGVEDALIDTGEFGAAGHNGASRPWTLALQHPRIKDSRIALIRMDGRFLATSGDYATRFSDDFRHHHVLDPRTGDSSPEFACVAIAARTGLEADGLATALMVLGRADGEALLARFDHADAVWIDKAMNVSGTAGMPLAEA